MRRLLPCSYAALLAATLWPFAAAGSAHAATCEGLSALKLPSTVISAAEAAPAGTFTPPQEKPVPDLPAFCRVTGVIQPTADSYIRFEVWLPASGWNKKFLGVGNGGFAGSISYSSLGNNLGRGYATAATDTGHIGNAADATWAYNHSEKVADFGYRALHLTTENAKAIIQAFYSEAPQRSYFDSCSDGGREALMEAQRFPEDYDGILAGAPANYWTHLLTGGLAVEDALLRNPAAYISDIKLHAINQAVLAVCDAQDGVKDGFVDDPRKCNFDPAALRCNGVDSRSCLTEPQVGALKAIYAGGRDSNGKQIFPGFMPGGEDGWTIWVIGYGPGLSAGSGYVENYFRYMVYQDPAWNPISANVDAAVHTADETTARVLNATDPDLHAFEARGGKLILYHGWNDPAISPVNTVNYYEAVRKKMGAEKADKFVRLYMAPGVEHCTGGPGPSWFGQLGTTTAKGPKHGIFDALEAWVEKGTAPAEIIATKYPGKRSAQTRGNDAPALPLSGSGPLQGLRRHKRLHKFRLQCARCGKVSSASHWSRILSLLARQSALLRSSGPMSITLGRSSKTAVGVQAVPPRVRKPRVFSSLAMSETRFSVTIISMMVSSTETSWMFCCSRSASAAISRP